MPVQELAVPIQTGFLTRNNFLDQVNVPLQSVERKESDQGRYDPTELVPCLLPSPGNGSVTLPWLRRRFLSFKDLAAVLLCVSSLWALRCPMDSHLPCVRFASDGYKGVWGLQIYLHRVKKRIFKHRLSRETRHKVCRFH